jgi:hypothetical protein
VCQTVGLTALLRTSGEAGGSRYTGNEHLAASHFVTRFDRAVLDVMTWMPTWCIDNGGAASRFWAMGAISRASTKEPKSGALRVATAGGSMMGLLISRRHPWQFCS